MLGFRSKFGADGAGAVAAATAVLLFCTVSCLNGYPGIKTSVQPTTSPTGQSTNGRT